MIISTRLKIGLARIPQRLVMLSRRARGLGPVVVARRRDITWRLDLREGIDFAIYIRGALDPAVLDAYRRLIPHGASVLDIGANIGAHTLPLAKAVGAAGRVIAVEPTRYAFERLQDELALNPDLGCRVTARQAMLMGSEQQPLVPAIPSSWPLATPEDAHYQHLGVEKSTEGAAVTTVDALLREARWDRLDLIKLDVDGYELDVLRGAHETLGRFGPTIVFEHAPYTLAEKGYDPDEMLALLREAGYRFSTLKGRQLQGDGVELPRLPAGASINVVAERR